MPDIFTGTLWRDETAEERSTWLAKKRQRALAKRKRQAHEYWTWALSEAVRRHKDGQPLPIHFDVVYRVGRKYSEHERWSLVSCEIQPDCGKEDAPKSSADWVATSGVVQQRTRKMKPHFQWGDLTLEQQ